MFNTRLFRLKAFIRRAQPERLDNLLCVTPPHEWAILSGLILVLLGLVTWGAFGSIERSLSADCVLVRPGERRAVVSGVDGTVVDVLVNIGDKVTAGQAIARVQLPEEDRQMRIARAKVELLAAQLQQAPTDQIRQALDTARGELLEREAVAAAGDLIVSLHAGEVMALGIALGQAVSAGMEVAQIRKGDDHRLQAVAILEPVRAQPIKTGMTARILIETERGKESLDAEVRAVSPQPIAAPAWLADVGLPAPKRGQLVHLDFKDAPDRAILDGHRARLLIVTQRHAPVRLLLPAGIN